MPNDGEVAPQNDNQKQNPVSTKSQTMNVKLQMHLDVELQNRENVHIDFENSQHEGNEEMPDENMHEDLDSKRDIMQTRKEPVLEKYVRRHHHVDQIIGDKEARPMTRSRLRNETCLLSKIEPRIVSEAIQDDDWYVAMKEEIEQIEKKKTQTLGPRIANKNVIGTKQVFKNKLDENGEITRNKERLVCKGYAQEEGLDMEKLFLQFLEWKE